ncbi:MAG TPA: hypothetical protein VGV38_11145 [Pyrinomonadaceae bacterium]|nr:hypothetical protein [Pyrinomonadaceae bacterium]
MAKRVVVEDTGSQQSDQPTRSAVVLGMPIVIRVQKRKRKKKKGSSRTSRRLADIERHFSEAARRISKGMKNGWDEYLDDRDRSQRKRRDGALVDLCVNASKGTARAISESSPALTDITRAFNTKRMRKQIRRTLRPLPMIL